MSVQPPVLRGGCNQQRTGGKEETEKRGVFDRADVFQGGSFVTSVRVHIKLVNSR